MGNKVDKIGYIKGSEISSPDFKMPIDAGAIFTNL